ncbi:MAG: acyltransferase family protein [Actinomycetota bacterium]
MHRGKHIPALDGLRGFAVAAVVVYHAWPELLPGGWIGVSVFFTLSGFLITTIVARDHELSRASLATFWRRRARRLLPAALLTIAATVAAVAIVDPDRLPDTAEAGLAATVYVHNWWSAATTGGYWEIFDSAPSPLAHMWSLAIEEQVYVVWPLAVLALGLRRALFVGAGVVAVGTWFWWDTADAYYATPFRFGEVLAGAAVASVLLRRPDLRVPTWLVVPAVAVVVGLTATLGEGDPFVATGALSVIAVSAAVVVAWCATAPAAQRLLGMRPLGWLGQRSYAVYLFHWPLLVLLDAPPIVAVVATLALAELSHHLIEWPIRTGARLRSPIRTLGGATVASVVAFAVLASTATDPDGDDIAAATAAALAAPTTTTVAPAPTTTAEADVAGAVEFAPSTTTTTTAPPLPTVPVAADATVMLVGDSTAYNLRDAVAGWVEARGGTAVSRSFPLCSPVFDEAQYRDWATGFGTMDEPCRPRVDDGTDLVLVVDHGLPFAEHEHVPTGDVFDITDGRLHDAIRQSYETMIAQADAVGARLLIVTPPRPLFPELLADPDGNAETDRRMSAYRELLWELAAHTHVDVLDVGDRIQDDAERYPRSDGLHLDETTGAIHAVVDLIAPSVTFG